MGQLVVCLCLCPTYKTHTHNVLQPTVLLHTTSRAAAAATSFIPNSRHNRQQLCQAADQIEGPMPSVICVRTESKGGRSPTNRSQGGVPAPLLRTVPSSWICGSSGTHAHGLRSVQADRDHKPAGTASTHRTQAAGTPFFPPKNTLPPGWLLPDTHLDPHIALGRIHTSKVLLRLDPRLHTKRAQRARTCIQSLPSADAATQHTRTRRANFDNTVAAMQGRDTTQTARCRPPCDYSPDQSHTTTLEP